MALLKQLLLLLFCTKITQSLLLMQRYPRLQSPQTPRHPPHTKTWVQYFPSSKSRDQSPCKHPDSTLALRTCTPSPLRPLSLTLTPLSSPTIYLHLPPHHLPLQPSPGGQGGHLSSVRQLLARNRSLESSLPVEASRPSSPAVAPSPWVQPDAESSRRQAHPASSPESEKSRHCRLCRRRSNLCTAEAAGAPWCCWCTMVLLVHHGAAPYMCSGQGVFGGGRRV